MWFFSNLEFGRPKKTFLFVKATFAPNVQAMPYKRKFSGSYGAAKRYRAGRKLAVYARRKTFIRRRYVRRRAARPRMLYKKKKVLRRGTPGYAMAMARKIGMEVKHAPVIEQYLYFKNAYTSGGTYSAPAVTFYGMPMLSQITQGAKQSERVGNRIVIRDYYVNVYFNLTRDATEPQADGGTTTPSTGTYTRPTHITCFLGYPKAAGKTDTVIDSAVFQEFWQSGNESRPLTGLRGDSLLPINKDTWTVYRKIHCELIPVTTGQYAYEDPKNYPTDFKTSINLAKYLPTVVTYEDDNANPTNMRNLFMWFDAWPIGTITDQAVTTKGVPLEIRTQLTEHLSFYDP